MYTKLTTSIGVTQQRARSQSAQQMVCPNRVDQAPVFRGYLMVVSFKVAKADVRNTVPSPHSSALLNWTWQRSSPITHLSAINAKVTGNTLVTVTRRSLIARCCITVIITLWSLMALYLMVAISMMLSPKSDTVRTNTFHSTNSDLSASSLIS